MALIIFLLIIIVGVVFVVRLIRLRGGVDGAEKPKYEYRKKQFFMTRSEHEFYDTLVSAVGNDYYIFAQAHLPTLVDHKIRGQDWRAALAHINRKSVDFVLCDKQYISPKLAIELDDSSHERPDRRERDEEVERILKYAGVPLLRFHNHINLNTTEIATQIRSAIN